MAKEQRLTGTIIINSHQLNSLMATEITPGGNGQYAITVRQLVTKIPEMFREDLKGKLKITYKHPYLPDMHFDAVFLDFGIQDEKGECTLSLFFRAAQEQPAIVSPSTPKISLV